MATGGYLNGRKKSIQEIKQDAAGFLEWLLLESQADSGRQFSGLDQRTVLECSVDSSTSGFRTDGKYKTVSVCQDKFRSDDQTDSVYQDKFRSDDQTDSVYQDKFRSDDQTDFMSQDELRSDDQTDFVSQDEFRSDDQRDERKEFYNRAAQKLKELSGAARAGQYGLWSLTDDVDGLTVVDCYSLREEKTEDGFGHSQQTDSLAELEKEIAERVKFIVDDHKVDSSTVADCFGLEEEETKDGFGHSQQTDSLAELEKEIAEYLKSIADDLPSKMNDGKMKTLMYERFKQTIQHSLGSETSWKHLGILFYSVKGAVSIVGRGTTLMSYVQEITLRYFEEQYAAWVLDHGGFEGLGHLQTDYARL